MIKVFIMLLQKNLQIKLNAFTIRINSLNYKIKVQFFEYISTTARSDFTRPWRHLSPPNFKRQFDHRNYLKNAHPTH